MADVVVIEGLDELRREMRLMPKHFDYALRVAIRRAGQRTAKEAKGLLPARSRLARSITSRLQYHPIVAEVGSSARPDRVLSIHVGRRIGEPPASSAIARWHKNRGLEELSRRERAEVWKIVNAIRARGVRPLPFLTGALERALPEIDRYLRDALVYVMGKLARR